jgi:hypothetical protein
MQQALVIYKKCYGDEHPKTVNNQQRLNDWSKEKGCDIM